MGNRPILRRMLAVLLISVSASFGLWLVVVANGGPQPVCDVSWANPVSGNWNDSTKWDTGLVPGTTQNVCINATGGSYNVTLNVNTTIAGFSLDSASATFTASGRTFMVNGPSILTTGDVVWRSSGWGGIRDPNQQDKHDFPRRVLHLRSLRAGRVFGDPGY